MTVYELENAQLRDATEEVLVRLAVEGNHDAFGELVNRNKDGLFAVMLRLTRSRDQAEEIVQDTFVQAFLKLHTFEGKSAFRTWLCRIAFNKHSTLRRKNRPTASLESLYESSQLQPIDPQLSAENACLRSEAQQEVLHALARLDVDSRRILILREMKGLSYAEISDTLRVKLGTVRSKLSRARSKLLNEYSRKSPSQAQKIVAEHAT